jgi:hypothetical protein
MSDIPEAILSKARDIYESSWPDPEFRKCTASDCAKPYYGKGYCIAHYERWRRHGDPLAGVASPGEGERFVHEVALLHTGDNCLAWPYGQNGKGYGLVRIDGKKFVVSRYVCELVNGPSPTPEHEAAHSCGKGHEGCIAPGHLSWKTHAENEADKLSHGTRLRGERHSRAKLTEAEARQILAMKGMESQYKLAKRFMVSQTTISEIQTGRKWACLSEGIAA